jgi:hypothetical protein
MGGDHEMKFQLKKGILGGMGELNQLHEEAPGTRLSVHHHMGLCVSNKG